MDILECWHLGTQELETLTRDCLLPLAPAHASIELAHSLQLACESSSSGAVNQPVPAGGKSAMLCFWGVFVLLSSAHNVTVKMTICVIRKVMHAAYVHVPCLSHESTTQLH